MSDTIERTHEEKTAINSDYIVAQLTQINANTKQAAFALQNIANSLSAIARKVR